VPAERLGKHSSEHKAKGRAARAHEAIDAHCPRLVAGRGEQPDDHAQAHGRSRRAAGALDESRRDKRRLAGRQAARERRDREQEQPRQEDALPADQIAEPTG